MMIAGFNRYDRIGWRRVVSEFARRLLAAHQILTQLFGTPAPAHFGGSRLRCGFSLTCHGGTLETDPAPGKRAGLQRARLSTKPLAAIIEGLRLAPCVRLWHGTARNGAAVAQW